MSIATADIRFACIATNGSHAVVWGLGRTSGEAYRNANAETDGDLGPDVIVPVNAEQARACVSGRRGTIGYKSAGIELTREQLREIESNTFA
jgi:hypothetical protein